jgi:hypothetical protein
MAQHEVHLGQTISGEEQRDAIHIAVAPVVAAENLYAAQRIGLNEKGEAHSRGPYIGIVDPFMTEQIHTGDRFWMLLNPYTITTLRHHWEHPAFVAPAAPKVVPREETEEYLEAQRWLEGYAGNIGVEYDELIDHLRAFVDNGDYWNEGGRFEGEWAPDEIWDHYGVIRGKVVPQDDRGGLFSCSC